MTTKSGVKKREREFFGIDKTWKSPIQIEIEWFEKHSRGDIPQLTVRAVLMGAVLGVVMSLLEAYFRFSDRPVGKEPG
jgi:hypothetical protein